MYVWMFCNNNLIICVNDHTVGRSIREQRINHSANKVTRTGRLVLIDIPTVSENARDFSE